MNLASVPTAYAMSGLVPFATHRRVPISSRNGSYFILIASSESAAGHCGLENGTLLSIGVEYGFSLPLFPYLLYVFTDCLIYID